MVIAKLPDVPKAAHPYVQRALKSALAAVRSAANGSRNDVLNTEAFAMGGFVAGGFIDEVELHDALLSAIIDNGGDDLKDSRKILDAIEAGKAQPRALPEPKGKRSPASSTAPEADAVGGETPAPDDDDDLDEDDGPRAKCLEDLDDGRDLISVNACDLDRMLDEASASLGNTRSPRATSDVYKRNAKLVVVREVTRDEAVSASVGLVEGSPQMFEMELSILKSVLCEVAKFARYDRRSKSWVPIGPPKDVVAALHALKEWRAVRPIVGATETPVIRPDGSILQEPGYDASTRLLFKPNAVFPRIAEKPSQDECHARWEQLVDLYADFAHVDDERDGRRLLKAGSHKSAAIAYPMTILARSCIAGSVPIFAYTANVRGGGKSLQTDVGAIIVTGRNMPRMTYPSSDEELEKALGGYAIAGSALFCLDDVSRPFGGSPINRVATATDTIQLRLLGQTLVLTLAWRAVMSCTGTNLMFVGDTVRRVLLPTLLCPDVSPEDRVGFKYDGSDVLLAQVREHRPEYVAAILTILHGYIAAGSPDMGCKRWGSFEGFSRLIPHAIVWAGGADLMGARPGRDDEASPEVASIIQLVTSIYATKATGNWTASEIVRELFPAWGEIRMTSRDPNDVAAREAVEQLCGKSITPGALGRKIGGYKLKTLALHDGTLVRLAQHKSGGLKWKIEKVALPDAPEEDPFA